MPPMTPMKPTKTDIVAAKRAMLVLREAVENIRCDDLRRACRDDMAALCRVIRHAEGVTPITIETMVGICHSTYPDGRA